MTDYTKINFEDVEDSAVAGGFSPGLEARFPKGALGCTVGAVSLQRLAPNARSPFGHRHERQEELYVIVRGDGRMKLDDEIVELEEWDAVRVPPGTWRGYEAGPNGLEILVIGAPNLGEDPRGDVDGRRDWWAG